MMSFCAISVATIFDDVTLCKHVTTEDSAFVVFNYFLKQKKTHVILASNIDIVQIAISIKNSPSGSGFYVM